MTAITAAVVGVILNLAIWFALHTLFAQVEEVPFAGGTLDVPAWRSLNLTALLLTVASIVASFRFKLGVPLLLALAASAGLLLRVTGFV
jgi:chromate transporter